MWNKLLSWWPVLFPLAFAVILGGAAKIWGWTFGSRSKATDQPWLKRPDWAKGQIRFSFLGVAITLWIITAVWTAVYIRGFRWPPPPEIIPFALVSLLFLLGAVHLTRMQSRFGASVFELKTLPAVPGGVLAGTIAIARPLIFQDPINVHLACVEHVSQGSSSSTETVLWEDIYALDRYPPGAQVREVPVYFKIPPDGRPSQVNRYDSTRWRLDVRANALGGAYRAWFDVPVFVTDAPATPHDLPDPTRALRSASPARWQLLDHHIRVTPRSGGGCEYEFPPVRRLKAGTLLTAFGLVSIGAAAVVMQDGPPPWFRALFVCIGIVLLASGLSQLLTNITIIITRVSLSIDKTIAGIHRRTEIAAHDIREISPRIWGSSQTRATYSIHIVRGTGSPIDLHLTIRDKRDATWIANEWKKGLALEPPDSAPLSPLGANRSDMM